jgi:hypothetical protein
MGGTIGGAQEKTGTDGDVWLLKIPIKAEEGGGGEVQ